MKQLPVIAIAVMVWVAACSPGPGCGKSKEDFLKAYYRLVKEASALNLPVSDSKWKKYDEQFRAFVEECYEQHEAELRAKERRKFWSTSVKYYVERYGKGAIKELGKKKGRGPAKVIKEEVEKIWPTAKDALKEVTEEKLPKQVPGREDLPTE